MTPIQLILLLSPLLVAVSADDHEIHTGVSAGVQVQVVKTLPEIVLPIPSIRIEKEHVFVPHYHHHHVHHGLYYHHPYPLKHVSVSLGRKRRDAEDDEDFENVDHGNFGEKITNIPKDQQPEIQKEEHLQRNRGGSGLRTRVDYSQIKEEKMRAQPTKIRVQRAELSQPQGDHNDFGQKFPAQKVENQFKPQFEREDLTKSDLFMM